MKTIGLLTILILSINTIYAQDSAFYKAITPIKPVTNQQKSALEDSALKLYGNYKQQVNGNVSNPAKTVKSNKVGRPEDYDLYYALNYDFYSTFMLQTAWNLVDKDADRDNVFGYYNLSLNGKVIVKKVKLTTAFFNEYGYRKYFDSLGTKTDDLFYFKNNLSYPILKSRLGLNLMTNLKSQFWKTYNYRENQTTGEQERFLYSDYKSPGYFLFSGGLRYDFLESCNLELGLAGGKITNIKNKTIFDTRNQSKLYDVKKGEKRKVDFGINFQLNVPPLKLGKNLMLENFTQIYLPSKTISQPKSYTLDMNNALHLMFLKYMRFSFRTKLFYDVSVQEKMQIINQVSLGFYLTNRLD